MLKNILITALTIISQTAWSSERTRLETLTEFVEELVPGHALDLLMLNLGDLDRSQTAERIARCFLETDFWQAYDEYAHGARYGGTSEGIKMACLSPLGYSIPEDHNYLRYKALSEVATSAVIIIDKPGTYYFDGVGAEAKTVFVAPQIKGLVRISVTGHSRIHMRHSYGGFADWWVRLSGVVCVDDHFDGCINYGSEVRF